VCYPVLDLHGYGKDLHRYVATLEQTIIQTLAAFELEGHTVTGEHASGVWVGGRKIASIGVRCARWVTTHGLSLNVNLDLGVYDLFDACGLGGADFTSIAAATGRDISVAEVGEVFEVALAEQFQLAFDPLPVAV
jgi:lipoate-protein ligase B